MDRSYGASLPLINDFVFAIFNDWVRTNADGHRAVEDIRGYIGFIDTRAFRLARDVERRMLHRFDPFPFPTWSILVDLDFMELTRHYNPMISHIIVDRGTDEFEKFMVEVKMGLYGDFS